MKKYMKSLIIIGAITLMCIFINAPYASALNYCFWSPVYFTEGTEIHWCAYWEPYILASNGLWDYTNGHWEVGPYGVYAGGNYPFTVPHDGYFSIYSPCPYPNYPITYSSAWFTVP